MTSPLPSGSGYTTPISSVFGPTSTPSSSAAGGSEMGKDAFLKLLVAQLKYQDPMNPAQGAEFLAQTAQFTQVEKLSELATAQQNMVTAQLMMSASNLVGRTVTYTGADGAAVSGVVSSAKLGGSTPTLKVGNMDVPLSSVTEVHQTGS
jgi:flagellar basal-body rod modification protein FlgD